MMSGKRGPLVAVVAHRALTVDERRQIGRSVRTAVYLLTLGCGHHVLRTMASYHAACGHCAREGSRPQIDCEHCGGRVLLLEDEYHCLQCGREARPPDTTEAREEHAFDEQYVTVDGKRVPRKRHRTPSTGGMRL